MTTYGVKRVAAGWTKWKRTSKKAFLHVEIKIQNSKIINVEMLI